MRKQHIKKYLLAVILGIFMFQIPVSADVDKLSISQIIQEGNDVYLYVSPLDNMGKPAPDSLMAEQLAVNINEGQAIPVQDAAVFQSLDQGISYTFCIDISRSVTEQEMQDIRSSITEFVNGMSENDYAKIITIGTEITSVCDSTQDKNALNAAVQEIKTVSDYTYLYKGLSYALDSQRKNIDAIPQRAAIILFTDGMDDSDGAYTKEQVIADFDATRIPIYVIGLKGKTSDASLNSVGQIAQQSGGSIFSYSDMSVTEAVQTISDIMRNTYQLHVQPDLDCFGSKNLEWCATYTSEGYSVTSKPYIFSLGMDNVIFPTLTEEPASTPTPTPTPAVTLTQKPASTPAPKPKNTLEINPVIYIAAGIVLIALIIIFVVLLKKNKNRKQDFESESLTTQDEYEKTLADIPEDDQETIDGSDLFDDEMTIACNYDKGIRLEFEITFDGHTEIVEKTLKDQLILGRGDECDVDVVLHSKSEERKQTSRKHAFIFEQPDGLYIKDNSKNKTFLNGMEVMGEMALQDGDVLQMGKATVKVKILSY